MEQTRILLDTSAWIAYLQPTGNDDVKESVRRALMQDRVHICWVVKVELLVGATSEKAYCTLLENLNALPEVPISPQVWRDAAWLGYELRRKGMMIPLPDLLVAEAARQGKLVLWHLDQHFERIARQTELTTKCFLL